MDWTPLKGDMSLARLRDGVSLAPPHQTFSLPSASLSPRTIRSCSYPWLLLVAALTSMESPISHVPLAVAFQTCTFLAVADLFRSIMTDGPLRTQLRYGCTFPGPA